MIYENKFVVFCKDFSSHLLKTLIMSGEELKAKLSSYGVNYLQLSKALGYDSAQRLHSHFKADDVKSGVIERISAIIGKPISEIYGEESTISKSAQTIIEKQAKTIDSQQKTIDRLTKLLEQAS